MFTQSFGDSGETVAEGTVNIYNLVIFKLKITFLLSADTVSAVEFDLTGNFLATGDHGGRIVIFQKFDSDDDTTV